MKRSVVIPAHNEADTIADIISLVRPFADETIVVASACSDSTEVRARDSGAIVVPEPILGKHYAVRRGLSVARGQNVAFLDGDLVNPIDDLVERMFSSLTDEVLLAKGCYVRQADGEARLTEICARPLLALIYPSLAHFRDPLSGEFAVVNRAARQWRFAPGFAVDVGFLIQAAESGGVCEVELGRKQHKHRSVHALGRASVEVAATILGLANNPAPLPYSQTVDSKAYEYRLDLQSLPPLDG